MSKSNDRAWVRLPEPISEDDSATLEAYEALQGLINSGEVWRLPGDIGRAVMAAIKSGRCICALEPRFDYWGNIVPSRSMLKPGSHGTKEYSAAKIGPEWAEAIARVGAGGAAGAGTLAWGARAAPQ